MTILYRAVYKTEAEPNTVPYGDEGFAPLIVKEFGQLPVRLTETHLEKLELMDATICAYSPQFRSIEQVGKMLRTEGVVGVEIYEREG